MLQDQLTTAVPRPPERQAAPETTRCFFQALILFNDGLSKIKCVVRSLASPGARIEVSDAWYLPHEFDLFIPIKDETFHVAQLARDGDMVSVAFRKYPDVHAIERRDLDELRAENANLRNTNRLLADRLTTLGKVVDLNEPPFNATLPNIFSPR